MSTLDRTSDAQFFIVLEELCTLSRAERCTRGSTDGPVRILGEREGKDPEFQKEYLSVMPNEMQKLVRELPRDLEIITLSKESARRMYDCKTRTVQFYNWRPPAGSFSA